MRKSLFALSMGAFCLGLAEFIMMSILPDVAHKLDISIAQAGNLIAAYALGVCIGAPLIVIVTRNYPLRRILVLLMIIFSVGSCLTAIAPNYWLALCARFITGFPHGAFFGVSVIVANRLAKDGKVNAAIASVMMGMTVANLLGVPLGNLLGHYVSWRLIFLFTAVCGVLTILAILRWIPVLQPQPKSNIKGQFSFLSKKEPWLLMGVTGLGNAGIFAWYSYVSPFMTQVAGLNVDVIPFLMVLSGGSMCLGNYLGGRFSDRYAPGMVAMMIQFIMVLALVTIFFFGKYDQLSIFMMCIIAGCLFGVSAPQQQLFLVHSEGGAMMGGAMAQLAFNLGNALGAFGGGVAISGGSGVSYTALVGAVFVSLSIIIFIAFNRSNPEKAEVPVASFP